MKEEIKSSGMKNVVVVGLLLLLAHIAFAWLMYEVEYSNILSVKEYQPLVDNNHDRTTRALEICYNQSVTNHINNWDRICTQGYNLPVGCSLPGDVLAMLDDGIKKDNAACEASHKYNEPKVVGPAMDNQGHLLPQKK